jgi:S1-C subfamily serine protease
MRDSRRLSLSLVVLALASSVLLSSQAAPDQRAATDPNVFRAIARDHSPMVVAIKTTTWVEPASAEDAEWYERIFGRPLPRGPQVQREAASGFLISPEGDILTNDHVVADVDLIEVRLLGRDTTTYRATVVGRDPLSDSAVIRLVGGPANLPVATLGDSDSLEAGDWVMAIGNPYQLGHSVTVGVVSYIGRSFEIGEGRWQKLIQTDASINPGSSGGPLLNARGEVIGISLATLADGFGDTMGIGFAVPINGVKAVLPGLRAGRVVRGSLNLRLRHATLTDNDARALGLPAARGALITAVTKGSSADAAGLRPGDVIVELLGQPVATADDVLTRVSSARPGERARAVVIRDGRARAIDVTVEALPLPLSHRKRHDIDDLSHLGLTFGDLGSEGPIVERVEPGSAAETAGLEPGDVIRKINQHTIRTAAEARRELQRIPAGSTVFLLICRDDEEQIVEMDTE